MPLHSKKMKKKKKTFKFIVYDQRQTQNKFHATYRIAKTTSNHQTLSRTSILQDHMHFCYFCFFVLRKSKLRSGFARTQAEISTIKLSAAQQTNIQTKNPDQQLKKRPVAYKTSTLCSMNMKPAYTKRKPTKQKCLNEIRNNVTVKHRINTMITRIQKKLVLSCWRTTNITSSKSVSETD